VKNKNILNGFIANNSFNQKGVYYLVVVSLLLGEIRFLKLAG
jgi:hypothetical protein